jgi:UDP-glucose 4-epimerase
MTRFLLSLEQAVDTIFAALKEAEPGETYIPRVPSSLVTDIAEALIGDEKIEITVTGIRPGEKVMRFSFLKRKHSAQSSAVTITSSSRCCQNYALRKKSRERSAGNTVLLIM